MKTHPTCLTALTCLTVLALVVPLRLGAQEAPAIRVTIFGSGGGPAPNGNRAGPSAMVEAGGERLFVDAGRSVVQRMAQAGVLPKDITRLFLTHLHSDHTMGVPDLWLTGWW